jgi:ubiquinone/menaquinone biosynthesis C-methylase UbiE
MDPAEQLDSYYTATIDAYEDWHVQEGDEHYTALRYLAAYFPLLGIESVLDVGTGTGRALRWLADRHPEIRAVGVDPVPAMLDVAAGHGIGRDQLVHGHGEKLPFADGSFDAVCELGVLHHVPNPSVVIGEMTRVARRAVFLSDDNRFGYGTLPRQLVKLAVFRSGLGKLTTLARTRGRGYFVTDDDGVSYSYSVYDSLDALSEWADRLVLVPLKGKGQTGWMHPLFTATHILVCALKD